MAYRPLLGRKFNMNHTSAAARATAGDVDMTIAEFEDSNRHFEQSALCALWLAGRGEWERAHQVAQEDNTREGSWVHAYLHRAEGDTGNASYWYRRAARPVQTGDLRSEWEQIVMELLQSR
jgi:hypothetical protein